MQAILSAYSQQGVTGVRFMFALSGGSWSLDNGSTWWKSYSTPFDGQGNVSSTWTANLLSFFTDLKSSGITKVTPTSVMSYYWSGTAQAACAPYPNTPGCYTGTSSGCPTGSKKLYFFPWLPFGLDPNDHGSPSQYMYPDGRYPSSGSPPYSASQANQAFICRRSTRFSGGGVSFSIWWTKSRRRHRPPGLRSRNLISKTRSISRISRRGQTNLR